MKTVLIVEDNPTNLRFARDLLVDEGYRVLEAAEADTGLALAREHRPDVIVMDIQLPGTDGLSAVRLLRSEEASKHTPVVAMTAHAMRGDEARILEAGCDFYVAKPIRYQEFLDTVRAALEGGPR